jgi:hypothetical protein
MAAEFTDLMVLLDSRSIHNFIDVATTECVKIKFHGGTGLRVVVANDDRLSSPRCCNNLTIIIVGEPFVISCYGLALSSFDMVLRVQWLESLGLVLWDFHRQTLAFVWNGHEVLWTVMPSTAAPTTLAATTLDVMEELLLQYQDHFVMLIGVSLEHVRNHQIRLLLGTVVVVIRPYRYAHA